MLGDSDITTHSRKNVESDERIARRVLRLVSQLTVSAASNVSWDDFSAGKRGKNWIGYRFGKHAMAWCAAAPNRYLEIDRSPFRPYDDPWYPDRETF